METSTISEIRFGDLYWYVEITRRNGTVYQVRSNGRPGIEDYRNEFLQAKQQRKTR